MERTAIAGLRPELPDLDSRHISAVVTLIWPYSSSARQFALLLGEPDFRLRRKNGQVRVRFSGSSARAVASTGIGIGDHAVLSLRGAIFVREGAVNTPGKSIDWELAYSQTLSIRVSRDGNEIAHLDFTNVSPTPAPPSPVRRHEPLAVLDDPEKWSSPAFLKRTRLSDGPIFDAGYDPFADEAEDNYARKRRRKSYRDWNAWTYSARTPSPEKEGMEVDIDEELNASPIRHTALPETPLSLPRSELMSVAGLPLEQTSDAASEPQSARETPPAAANAPVHVQHPSVAPLASQSDDDFVRDTDYYDLYAGPDEFVPRHFQHASETGTNLATDEQVDLAQLYAQDRVAGLEKRVADEPEEVAQYDEVAASDSLRLSPKPSAAVDFSISLDDHPHIIMPPPTLPLLQTDFQTTMDPGMLTPIGKEPSSPALKPLDSSTLPMPSPFPGERDGGATSYLDGSSSVPLDALREAQAHQSGNESDYIGESSFYSSVSVSNAPAFHPTHESALTDVRFTFGMDGAGFSRLGPTKDSAPREPADALEEPGRIAETSSTRLDQHQAPRTLEEPMMQSVDIFPEVDNTPFTFASSPAKSPSPQPIEHSEVIILSSETESNISEDGLHAEFDHDSGGSSHKPADTEDGPNSLGEAGRLAYTIPEPVQGETDQLEFPEFYDNTAIAADLVSHRKAPTLHATEVQSPAPPTELIDLSSAHKKWKDGGEPAEDGRDGASHDDVADDHQVEDESNVIQPGENFNSDSQKDKHRTTLDSEHSLKAVSPDGTVLDTFSRREEMKPCPASLMNDHSDIKMESIEVHTPFYWESSLQQDNNVASDFGETAELVIAVPGEGHKIGEMQYKSVPATGPAKNTRSKTKASMSPAKENTPNFQKAKARNAPILRTSVSPVGSRVISVTPPMSAALPASPYNLRSQSRFLSPTKSTPSEFRREHSRRRSEKQDSAEPSASQVSAAEETLFPEIDFPDTRFGPSQELGMQYDKFANVPYVKDSEEGSAHSENSLSTVQYSDVDQMEFPMDAFVTTVQKTPPRPLYPVLSQPPRSSPSRDPRSMTPPEPAYSSLRRSLRLRRDAYDQPLDDEPGDQTTPKAAVTAGEVAYPTIPTSSPPPSQAVSSHEPSRDRNEVLSSSTQHRQTLSVSTHHQSLDNSNAPLTPEATQQSFSDSYPLFTANTREHPLPLTPQLTQTDSAAMDSFQDRVEMEEIRTEPLVNPLAVIGTGKEEAMVFEKAVPGPISPDLRNEHRSDEEFENADQSHTKLDLPSVGLSTPIAYYTPLKDLSYFLNRSSQFHSASSPDVLGLVTSGATDPQRATKGPKHWHTTLHVTDLSSYPSQISVQIFRAYAEALPTAAKGDVILLRAFQVKSVSRHAMLISGEESAWCVWKYGQPQLGKTQGYFGETRVREEVNGPTVERGDGERREVERLRGWYKSTVEDTLKEKEANEMKTRSKEKSKL